MTDRGRRNRARRRVWRRSLLAAIGLSLAFAASSAAQPQARQVLLLNSFERAPYAFYTGVFRTEVSRRTAAPINFIEVSIQPTQFVSPAQEEAVVNYIAASLAGPRLDLVVSVGGPAGLFAQKYRTRLFPTTPFLQSGADVRFLGNRPSAANETTVAVRLELWRPVENMLVLLPNTNRIVVVIGNSPFEDFWRRELERDLARFKGRITFEWWNQLSFQDMLKRASTLPPRSAILYGLLSVDAAGIVQSEERELAELYAVANAPMFGIYDTQMGRGVVGGPLMSITDLGRHSAEVAARILAGESPDAIATSPPQGHSRPTYDWRELQRWGISEARLPAGSDIRFRRPGVWEQYRWYIVAAILLLALQSALIGGLAVQRRRRRRTEGALRESEQRFRFAAEQNQDLAGRLINAQEEERSRIARDLHDDVSQQIAGVSIMLSGLRRQLKPSGPRPEVDETVTTLQQRTTAVAEAIRHLSHDLHPGVLKHAGLGAALAQHCAEIEQHHGLAVTVAAHGDLDSLEFDTALCLYRVTQEALTNIVRHAQARTAHIELARSDTGVELRIVDDGIGFDVNGRSASGLGLRSIDERVRLAHGHVRVESQPGRGTRLYVDVPSPPPVSDGAN